MSTRVATNFANKHMGKFEDYHVYTYHLQPFIYIRQVDDIFIIWQHDLNELNKCVDHLNSSTVSIKVTIQCFRETVCFLDTKIKLRDATLYTDLYSNHLTLTAIYCTVHPTNTTIRKAFLTVNSYGSDISVATSLILTNTPWNLHLTSMNSVIPAS